MTKKKHHSIKKILASIASFFTVTVPHHFVKLKQSITLPVVTIFVAFCIGVYHWFSYLIPFTDNAFVVTNVTPVAADVSGFVTEIYVKNGEVVKQGQPIFKVYQRPYQLTYQQTCADYKAGIKKILVFERQIKETIALVKSIEAELGKVNFELNLKEDRSVVEAVSVLEIKKLYYDKETLANKCQSLRQKIATLKASILEQKQIVKSLKAKKDFAKVNLDLTVVKAPGDGVIDNMYVSNHTPIRIHQPIFSFIDTSNYYIQANFNETDLRYARLGDKVIIIMRMYYFTKIFHGVIVNGLWAAQRQKTAVKSQIQEVSNQNDWLLLPQRFPLQIKILDPDPNYPLHPGASAYVYIKTKR